MLKVGVIGLGSISEHHINPYLNNDEVELVALCDINEQRLKDKGQQYNVQKLYSDHRELLKDDAIDAVSICTWNNSHAEIAEACLKAGKHVLVEKPLSITLEEAAKVKKAAEESNKVAQVGFVRRFGNNTKLLKEFIDSGELGKLYYAKASILRRLGNPGGWFSDKERSGGGPLIDLGVHVIDLCWYLMGKPKPVSVSGNTYSKLGNRNNIKNLDFYKAADYDPIKNDVEDLANVLIRFDNGASLFVDVSFTLHMKKDETSIKLYGDQGGAEIEPELLLVKEMNNRITNIDFQIDNKAFDFRQAFHSEVNHFVDCCLGRSEVLAPISDGYEIMKILNAVYESAESKREIYFT
ncbi:Gfo/Idh/MocA family oxidoreductase [Bacillus tianshenii]|uniref:Gfo/Idh/MocA family protein n=1 Tax=Sutcliffiella tianshenii TaxID=1463404 RepID=UPI001CD61C41|nr:Gfo/Idh/MocA family oxidoreductase [Bacillus tianshenii]MCA1321655.1 Gfo/Idh/MocA family oxidoreductase [Bacillus tianshenii]